MTLDSVGCDSGTVGNVTDKTVDIELNHYELKVIVGFHSV